MSNFHPLEVVGRGSDTQLQVGEYILINKFSRIRVKVYNAKYNDDRN